MERKNNSTQIKRTYRAFQEGAKTMLMVSLETGILRANICRYVAELDREGKLDVSHVGLCRISKHRAKYITAKKNC